jgi:hypothetical protein
MDHTVNINKKEDDYEKEYLEINADNMVGSGDADRL